LAKQAAFGTSIKITAGTVVGNVKSIKGPGISLDTVDVTTHDSASGWEEVVATILRSGEVTLEVVYDPANAQIKNAAGGLLNLLTTRTSANFTITLPSAAAIVFQAYVTGFEPDMATDGSLNASVKMKCTGAVTLP
jgi:predicted secreted protein